MSQRATTWLLVVLAATAAVAWWLTRDPSATTVQATRATQAPPSPGREGAVDAASQIAQAPPAPLPPPDVPLAQVLPGLRADADAGDRRAACRLGMELLRCQHLGAWDAQMEPFMGEQAEAAYEAKGDLAAANQVAGEKLWRIERLAQCRAVSADLQGQGARYLRQSALAGDPHAMFAYAEGHHWGPSMRGLALDPMFDQWRREAPTMIHAALRAGNPAAAVILQINYSDDFGYLSALIPNDAYRSYVYHLLAVRLFGHRERPGWPRELDADEIERARREADDLHTRYFDGRRFPSSLSMRYPPYMRTPGGQSPALCEDEP